MPTHMMDNPIRCCLPQEEFQLVYAHEKEEMLRYRGFALSFRPHHPCISRLMVALGIECEERLERLLAASDCLDLDRKLTAHDLSPDLEAQLRSQHFFVTGDDIAQLTLTQVLAASCNSRVFYQLMLDSCGTPELNVLLRDFVEQKHNTSRILEEVLETWDSSLVCQRPQHVTSCAEGSCPRDRIA